MVKLTTTAKKNAWVVESFYIFPLKVTCLEALPIIIHQIFLLTQNMTKYAQAETGEYPSDISYFHSERRLLFNWVS